MTEELLEVLWVLERTIRLYPELADLLGKIVGGATFSTDELPTPSAAERRPPEIGSSHQLGLPSVPAAE